MKFSVENSQSYVSYIRGKSNVLQVFDTKRDEVVASINYSGVFNSQIKGLLPYGDSIDELKHLIIDKEGNVVFDRFKYYPKKKGKI